MPTIRRLTLLLATAALATSCATNSAISESRQFLDEGYVLQAFQRIEQERNAELAAGGTVDADVQAAYDEIHFRLLLEQGRQAIYADHESRGMELLNRALTLRPNDIEAQELILRARRKLAARATRRGLDNVAKGELEDAIKEFGAALEQVPGYEDAQQGILQVRERFDRLRGEAQQQVLEAVRKLPEFRFVEVDWHAQAALSRDKTREDAKELQRRAHRELADEARRRGDDSRAAKNYGAALMDYRAARQYWPELPGIDDQVAQMEKEVEVVELTQRAQLAIKSRRLAEAKNLLDEAFEKSTLERGTIGELRFDLRQTEGKIAYEAARDLELQGLKAEAVAAYQKIVEGWPDGLLDEKTRLGALQTDVKGAETEFAAGEAAEQANDQAAALEHYQAAKTYYEKYRDVAARVARLSAAKAADGKQ